MYIITLFTLECTNSSWPSFFGVLNFSLGARYTVEGLTLPGSSTTKGYYILLRAEENACMQYLADRAATREDISHNSNCFLTTNKPRPLRIGRLHQKRHVHSYSSTQHRTLLFSSSFTSQCMYSDFFSSAIASYTSAALPFPTTRCWQ